MKHQLTQIRPLPVVAGDGKLPLPLADTGLPLYTRAMNAIIGSRTAFNARTARSFMTRSSR